MTEEKTARIKRALEESLKGVIGAQYEELSQEEKDEVMAWFFGDMARAIDKVEEKLEPYFWDMERRYSEAAKLENDINKFVEVHRVINSTSIDNLSNKYKGVLKFERASQQPWERGYQYYKVTALNK